MRAPFPWFGGKSRVAHLAWPRFGNVRTYVEPFYGSGAILLARELELARLGIDWAPGDTIETVNDLDPYVTNFWRATQRHADRVAVIADYPVMEADLHARHATMTEAQRKAFMHPIDRCREIVKANTDTTRIRVAF